MMENQTDQQLERKKRERLEALSEEEAQEAARNFWRWFEKVKRWDEVVEAKTLHPSRS